MIKVYVRQIQKGNITILNVPPKYREAVQDLIDALNESVKEI